MEEEEEEEEEEGGGGVESEAPPLLTPAIVGEAVSAWVPAAALPYLGRAREGGEERKEEAGVDGLSLAPSAVPPPPVLLVVVVEGGGGL